jgi:hypothetical protein
LPQQQRKSLTEYLNEDRANSLVLWIALHRFKSFSLEARVRRTSFIFQRDFLNDKLSNQILEIIHLSDSKYQDGGHQIATGVTGLHDGLRV